MRVWEFKDNQGYKWLITKENDNDENMIQQVVTFSRTIPDWDTVDEAKESGRLKFIKEYELKQV